MKLVTSFSTESFILALRRFISSRGHPLTIYTDNGKNLVEKSNELKNIDWNTVKDYGSLKKINWKLNPPSSPWWWWGFWERLIGMLKIILRRVLGKACLAYEEIYTVGCDAESVINSRPLTYLSEVQEHHVAYTPAMFLQEIREWSPRFRSYQLTENESQICLSSEDKARIEEALLSGISRPVEAFF
ncbi:integrase catalytic domain-containing protein [Trichonephila clavipes]|nr:integrase catalytic domain-containing protein [Trichonephila clavipes]